MTFHLWNVNGLIYLNKLNEKKLLYISETLDEQDVICLTETHLNDSIETKILNSFFPNHEIARVDRDTTCGGKTRKGGVLTIIPKTLRFSTFLIYSDGYTETLGVDIQTLELRIVNSYIPGDTRIKEYTDVIESIKNNVKGQNMTNIILCGDYNHAPPIV